MLLEEFSSCESEAPDTKLLLGDRPPVLSVTSDEGCIPKCSLLSFITLALGVCITDYTSGLLGMWGYTAALHSR